MPASLRQQHVDGALGRRLGGEFIALDAARQIAFVRRFADRLTARQFQSQRGHPLQRRHHAGDRCAGVDDVNIFAIQAGADVVFVHAGDGGDAELLLRGVADRAAGDAITAALEGRAGDQQVGFEFGRVLEQFGDGLILLFGEKVVAAKNCRDDFGVFAERLLERAAGADHAGFDGGADIAFVLAAHLGEELIQIMNDADLLAHVL